MRYIPFVRENNFLVSSEQQTRWYDDEDPTFEAYGHKLAPATTRNFVTDTEVILGGYKVILSDYHQPYLRLLKDRKLTFKWYVVRQLNGSFICGLDIIENDRYWLGEIGRGETFDHMTELLETLRTRHGDDFYICLEEEMPA
jgi:hypothetical protein